MIVKSVAVAFHALGLVLNSAGEHKPVRNNLNLFCKPETQILQAAAIFIGGYKPVAVPVHVGCYGIRAGERSCPE